MVVHSVLAVHQISGRPVKTLERPHGQDGCRSRRSSSTPHLMGRGPDRPVKTPGSPHGRAERPIQSPYVMGRGPVRPITFSDDGP